MSPKVSIVCITYNQERFIREALMSFVEQVADFAFEIIVCDDCSSDRTAQIVREFCDKYPEKVFGVFRESNLGPWGNFRDAMLRARGDYVALCEGDDFFVDAEKISRQAHFLDVHPNYAMCFSRSKWFFDGSSDEGAFFPAGTLLNEFTLSDLLRGNFISTDSVMYRRQNYEEMPVEPVVPGDWYCHLFHAVRGKIGFIDAHMSCYRRHSSGMWWDSVSNPIKLYEKYGLEMVRMFLEVGRLIRDDSELVGIVCSHLAAVYQKSSGIDQVHFAARVSSIAKDYGDFGSSVLVHLILHSGKQVSAEERLRISEQRIAALTATIEGSVVLRISRIVNVVLDGLGLGRLVRWLIRRFF